MAIEVLNVPEEYLLEVIEVLRAGLEHVEVSQSVRLSLTTWCDEEEAYILGDDE
jgi:hypothetical protein